MSGGYQRTREGRPRVGSANRHFCTSPLYLPIWLMRCHLPSAASCPTASEAAWRGCVAYPGSAAAPCAAGGPAGQSHSLQRRLMRRPPGSKHLMATALPLSLPRLSGQRSKPALTRLAIFSITTHGHGAQVADQRYTEGGCRTYPRTCDLFASQVLNPPAPTCMLDQTRISSLVEQHKEQLRTTVPICIGPCCPLSQQAPDQLCP